MITIMKKFFRQVYRRAQEPEPSPVTYRPRYEMVAGELFDVTTGRFIHHIGEATGTVRLVAEEAMECMQCGRAIKVGDEYEEDFVRFCSHCVVVGNIVELLANLIRPIVRRRMGIVKVVR